MFNYMLKRRKLEMKILSIIVLCAIVVFGILAKINNAALLVDISITLSVCMVVVGEIVIGMCFLPREFNYTVGMGRTRRDFYKSNIIITLLHMGLCYIVIIGATLGFKLLNLKGEAFGVIINPVYGIVVVFATLFLQLFYFWLFMEYPNIANIAWITMNIFLPNIFFNSLELGDVLVEGTVLNDYGEMVVFAIVGIVCAIGFLLVSKKILRMQVKG